MLLRPCCVLVSILTAKALPELSAYTATTVGCRQLRGGRPATSPMHLSIMKEKISCRLRENTHQAGRGRFGSGDDGMGHVPA